MHLYTCNCHITVVLKIDTNSVKTWRYYIHYERIHMREFHAQARLYVNKLYSKAHFLWGSLAFISAMTFFVFRSGFEESEKFYTWMYFPSRMRVQYLEFYKGTMSFLFLLKHVYPFAEEFNINVPLSLKLIDVHIIKKLSRLPSLVRSERPLIVMLNVLVLINVGHVVYFH